LVSMGVLFVKFRENSYLLRGWVGSLTMFQEYNFEKIEK